MIEAPQTSRHDGKAIDKTFSCWLLIPAAGIGSRMAADKPKQYLPLIVSGQRQTVIEATLAPWLAMPVIKGVIVVLSPEDEYWQHLEVRHHPKISLVEGGAERCDSVLNGLTFLLERAEVADWVLVHDAARPCVATQDIENLIATVCSAKNNTVGGLLASRVTDTLKQQLPGSLEGSDTLAASDLKHKVAHTVDRSVLWRALTPQMFKPQQLYKALKNALASGQTITDEASAMEWQGLSVELVPGRSDNIKITQPEDLALAEFILSRQLNDSSTQK